MFIMARQEFGTRKICIPFGRNDFTRSGFVHRLCAREQNDNNQIDTFQKKRQRAPRHLDNCREVHAQAKMTIIVYSAVVKSERMKKNRSNFRNVAENKNPGVIAKSALK